jgi:uncharacterized protein (DUF305 family)
MATTTTTRNEIRGVDETQRLKPALLVTATTATKRINLSKIFLLATFTTVLLACSNSSTNNSPGTDSSNHAAHNTDSSNYAAHSETSSDTINAAEVNAVKAAMGKMMHKMHGAKPTGNNDIDFAAMMLEHHKGAVDMSKVEVSQGKNAAMKAFAQKVLDDQNKEIDFMLDFISRAPKTPSSNSADFRNALNGSMMAMMDDNTTVYNEIDKDFAVQMIPHHQSAVDMAKVYLQYGQEANLKTLSLNIISSQEKDINCLKQWLTENGK